MKGALCEEPTFQLLFFTFSQYQDVYTTAYTLA